MTTKRKQKNDSAEAECQADKERLDWLQEQSNIEIQGSPGPWAVGEQIDNGEEYESLREAIDAARAEEAG